MAIINFNIQSTLCFKIYRKFSVGVWCGTAMIQVCLKYKKCLLLFDRHHFVEAARFEGGLDREKGGW